MSLKTFREDLSNGSVLKPIIVIFFVVFASTKGIFEKQHASRQTRHKTIKLIILKYQVNIC